MGQKPTQKPNWATSGSAQLSTITDGKRAVGFVDQEKPPSAFLNELWKEASEWIDHLEEITDALDFVHGQIQAKVAPNNQVEINPVKITFGDDTIEILSVTTSPAFSDADDTNDRIDLITISDAGALVIVEGTPAGSPQVPAYAGRVVMAEITIRNQVTIGQVAALIVTGDIKDTRPFLRSVVDPESQQTITGQKTFTDFVTLLKDGLVAKFGDEATITFAAITDPAGDASSFVICLNGDASTFDSASPVSGGDGKTVRGLVGYPENTYDIGQSVFLVRFVSFETISRVSFYFANRNWIDGEDINLSRLFRVGQESAEVVSGSDGATTASSTTFTSGLSNFTAAGVVIGDRLRIKTGSDVGVYIIDSVGTTTLTVTVAPATTDSGLEFDIFDDPKDGIVFNIEGTRIQSAADPENAQDVATKASSHTTQHPGLSSIVPTGSFVNHDLVSGLGFSAAEAKNAKYVLATASIEVDTTFFQGELVASTDVGDVDQFRILRLNQFGSPASTQNRTDVTVLIPVFLISGSETIRVKGISGVSIFFVPIGTIK